MNAPDLKNMVFQEAKECVAKINSGLHDIRHLVLELYEREGWSALGYPSWRACVTAEFKGGQSYCYYQLEAARVERNLSTIVKNDPIPESHLRPLTKLKNDPDKQREAWQKALETAPGGKITAALVNKIVQKMTGPDKPRQPKRTQPITINEPVPSEFQAAFDKMVMEIEKARATNWEITSHAAAIEMIENLLTMLKQ